MSWIDRLLNGASWQAAEAAAPAANPVRADGTTSMVVYEMDDPRFAEFIRSGCATASGVTVSPTQALRNPTVFRCVELISSGVAMLPLHLLRQDDQGNIEKARDHPLFELLYSQPNAWQTAFEFRSQMQATALMNRKGAMAMIVRSRGRVIRLVPLDSDRMDIVQRADFSVKYVYRRKSGGTIELDPTEVLHLRGITFDGINGVSRVEQAAEAIGLALQAERATARLYMRGSFVDGVLESKGKLSDEAFERLKASWNDRYSGADNAGKTPLLEEETTYKPLGHSARDSQTNEMRRLQVEEIGRVFGVPRPLLMMDDTGWGTGIEQLSIGFVRYGLNPWFRAWTEAISRSLLTPEDRASGLYAKFNVGALLNGTLKDQGEFLGRMLGAGGTRPVMTQNEARGFLDLTRVEGGDELVNPMTEPTQNRTTEPVDA